MHAEDLTTPWAPPHLTPATWVARLGASPSRAVVQAALEGWRVEWQAYWWPQRQHLAPDAPTLWLTALPHLESLEAPWLEQLLVEHAPALTPSVLHAVLRHPAVARDPAVQQVLSRWAVPGDQDWPGWGFLDAAGEDEEMLAADGSEGSLYSTALRAREVVIAAMRPGGQLAAQQPAAWAQALATARASGLGGNGLRSHAASVEAGAGSVGDVRGRVRRVSPTMQRRWVYRLEVLSQLALTDDDFVSLIGLLGQHPDESSAMVHVALCWPHPAAGPRSLRALLTDLPETSVSSHLLLALARDSRLTASPLLGPLLAGRVVERAVQDLVAVTRSSRVGEAQLRPGQAPPSYTALLRLMHAGLVDTAGWDLIERVGGVPLLLEVLQLLPGGAVRDTGVRRTRPLVASALEAAPSREERLRLLQQVAALGPAPAAPRGAGRPRRS